MRSIMLPIRYCSAPLTSVQHFSPHSATNAACSRTGTSPPVVIRPLPQLWISRSAEAVGPSQSQPSASRDKIVGIWHVTWPADGTERARHSRPETARWRSDAHLRHWHTSKSSQREPQRLTCEFWPGTQRTMAQVEIQALLKEGEPGVGLQLSASCLLIYVLYCWTVCC